MPRKREYWPTEGTVRYAKKEKVPAYRVHCQTNCEGTSSVCGHDGETYRSQCEALAARVTVDYPRPCRVLGVFLGNSSGGGGGSVWEWCVLRSYPSSVIQSYPPGLAVQCMLLSFVSCINRSWPSWFSGPVSMQQTVDVLSHLLEILECDVFGFLGVDQSEVVILIRPITLQPSMLQVQACIREAERIEYLVQTDSPLLKAYTTLTPFLLAPMRAPSTLAASDSQSYPPSLPLLLVLICLTMFTRRTMTVKTERAFVTRLAKLQWFHCQIPDCDTHSVLITVVVIGQYN